MNKTNKLGIAIALALASVSAQAQNKALDIGIESAARPTVASATPAAPAIAKQVPATPPVQQVAANVARPPLAPAPVIQPAAVKPTPAVQPQYSSPVSAPTVAAEVRSQPSTGIEAETNPFTGRELSAEQRQRQLENAKMDTELIQEKLKQANLIADLTYLPVKKRSEVITLPGVAKEAVAAAAAGKSLPGEAVEQKPKLAKKKQKSKASSKAAPTPAVVAPHLPKITVSGISINGAHASAILDIDGGVVSAQNGDMTPLGRVRIVDESNVRIGERTYSVRGTVLSRMVVSDPVVLDDEKYKALQRSSAQAPAAKPSSAPLVSLPPLPPLPPAQSVIRAPQPAY